MSAKSTKEVLAWLDARGWPHDPWELTGEQDAEMRQVLKICGHRNRRQEPCSKAPLTPGGRCKNANGKPLKGPLNPAWIDGRQSQVLPIKLATAVEMRRKHLHLMDLDKDIALADILSEQIVGRMVAGDPRKVLDQAQEAFAEFQAATKAGQQARMGQALARLERALTTGSKAVDDALGASQEAREWIEGKRKLIETEIRRQEKARSWYQREVVSGLVRALIETVVTEVKGTANLEEPVVHDILARISDRFTKLVSGALGDQGGGGDGTGRDSAQA